MELSYWTKFLVLSSEVALLLKRLHCISICFRLVVNKMWLLIVVSYHRLKFYQKSSKYAVTPPLKLSLMVTHLVPFQ